MAPIIILFQDVALHKMAPLLCACHAICEHLLQGCQIFSFKFFLERPNLFAICNDTFSKVWEGWRMSCRRVLSSTPLLVRVRKPVETAENRNFQTRTYKQETQLIQVARIWQTGHGASIDAGAFGLAARWVRRWVHWGVQWCEHCNGSWIGWFRLWLLVFEGHYGWRNLIRTRGHPLLVARLRIENVLKFQCLNWMLYPRVECRMSRWGKEIF
jgi:hypothetical protein